MSREDRACKIGVQGVGRAVVAAALIGAAYLTAISVLANYAVQYGVSEEGRHPYLVLAIWSLLPFAFMIPSALLCRLNACRGRWIVAGVTLCASLIVWLPRLVTVARDRAYDYGEPLTCLCKYAFSYELFISGAIIAIVLLCRWKRIGLCVLSACILLVGTHAYLLYDLPWEKPDPRFEIPLPFETIKENDALAQTNRPWMSPFDAVEAYVKFHEAKGLWDKEFLYLGGAVFLDVNFDGVLELMTVECGGSACCYCSTLFWINPQTKIVEELVNTGSAGVGDWCGARWDSGTMLIQDKVTNERRYVSNCSVRSDSRAEFIQCGVRLFDFVNCEFCDMTLASVTADKQNDLHEYEFSYVICGREYPRSEFEEKLEEFSERYISLDLKLGIIPECELQNLTSEKLRGKLMMAYKAFDYRGNVFAR